MTPTERYIQCRDLCRELALRPQPLSPDELAAYNAARAREMHAYEEMRKASQQPDLLDKAA